MTNLEFKTQLEKRTKEFAVATRTRKLKHSQLDNPNNSQVEQSEQSEHFYGKISGKVMNRQDKYGRGSAAANGDGFVDLAPGDTFAALEEQLKQRIADRIDNLAFGISASIGSKRNASELAKHLASGEEEEIHKFAAKNIGVLFARGKIAISHFDKKAVDETREKPRVLRVFSSFVFAGKPLVATITLKLAEDGLRLYAIEALDIMRDEGLEVRLAAEPRQFKTTRLLSKQRIAYYVGDVNRTRPMFVNLDEPFAIDHCAVLVLEMLQTLLTRQLKHFSDENGKLLGQGMSAARQISRRFRESGMKYER